MNENIFTEDTGCWWVILLLMLFSDNANLEEIIEKYQQEQENN